MGIRRNISDLISKYPVLETDSHTVLREFLITCSHSDFSRFKSHLGEETQVADILSRSPVALLDRKTSMTDSPDNRLGRIAEKLVCEQIRYGPDGKGSDEICTRMATTGALRDITRLMNEHYAKLILNYVDFEGQRAIRCARKRRSMVQHASAKADGSLLTMG